MSLLTAALLLAAGAGQEDAPALVPSAPEAAWEIVFEVYGADLPDDDPWLLATLQADRGLLHLESRLGYEDRDTLSIWAGRNFFWDDAVSGRVAPMLGLLVGRTEGAAPGVSLELGWRQLWLTTETEYVFDFGDRSESFFYSWNELGLTLVHGLDVGFVAQRTRVFEQDLTLDSGILVRWAGEQVGLTVYVFEPGRDDSYLAFALDYSF